MKYEYDLISIGGGYAGLAAAARAAQLGMKAAVLERGSEVLYACNSRYAGGVMHVSYNDPKSAPDVLTQAINEICAGHADPELVSAVAHNAGRAVEWLRSEGANFARAGNIGWRQWILAPLRPAVTQMDWKGRGADVALRVLEKNLSQRGGTLYRDTEVIELIVDSGECVGALARQGSAEVEFCARAVVLADGGFQGNGAMVAQSISPAPRSLKQRGAGTGMGDALRMARAAGAAISDLQAFYGHVLSRDAMVNDRVWPYPQLDELAAAGMVVNRAGHRIADEGMGGVYIANHIARQADPLGTTVIFDEAIWQGPGRAAAVPPNATLLTAGGTLHKADTLSALAAKLNLDADALETTLRDYNAALGSGSTSSLQPPRSATRRKPMPISTAPFYGAPVCAGLTYTMGGVRINAHAEVLREDLTSIPGLYAAGAATGGLEGGLAVGYVGGLIKALTFGLLAAERAAAKQKRA
jgi:fumarate reductase flavoprotein subunit